MIACGMADAGYQYVSVDDCWMNAGREAGNRTNTIPRGVDQESACFSE